MNGRGQQNSQGEDPICGQNGEGGSLERVGCALCPRRCFMCRHMGECTTSTVDYRVHCVSMGLASCRTSGARGPRVVGHKCTLLERSLHEVTRVLTVKEKWHSLTWYTQIWLLKITTPNKQTPQHFLRVNAKVLYKSHAHSF